MFYCALSYTNSEESFLIKEASVVGLRRGSIQSGVILVQSTAPHPKHSVAAAAAIRDEEELYSDTKSGNDDRVDSVNPARGSWRSARRPHGGRLERFLATRVQICDKSPQ